MPRQTHEEIQEYERDKRTHYEPETKKNAVKIQRDCQIKILKSSTTLEFIIKIIYILK